jgi:hypothetical protein
LSCCHGHTTSAVSIYGKGKNAAKKAQPYGYAPKISLSFQIILKYMLSIQQGR